MSDFSDFPSNQEKFSYLWHCHHFQARPAPGQTWGTPPAVLALGCLGHFWGQDLKIGCMEGLHTSPQEMKGCGNEKDAMPVLFLIICFGLFPCFWESFALKNCELGHKRPTKPCLKAVANSTPSGNVRSLMVTCLVTQLLHRINMFHLF